MDRDAQNAEHSPGVLHLGEVRAGDAAGASAGPGEPPAAHPRRRWIVPVVVFLVGVLVGSYAWLARSDMIESARVDLIVTGIDHDAPHSDGTITSVIGHVRNVGDKKIMVTRAWLPGQSAPGGDRDGREAEIAPGDEAAIALGGELNCETGVPDAVEADVRTPEGETSTRLPVPPTNPRHNWLCRSAEGEVWIERARPARDQGLELAEPVDSGLAVTIPLSIRSWSVDEVEVVDVAVSAGPGLDVEPGGIVGQHETGTVADLRLELTITDCEKVHQVTSIDIAVTFADHPPDTVRGPDPILSMLASLADGVCGP